ERQTGDRNQEVVGVAGLAGAVGACEQVQGRHQQAGWMTRLPSSSSSEYDSPAPENRSASSNVALRAAMRSVHSSRTMACSCSSSASDRKSTRLNSSHVSISYAVFCLKKK